jgi:hypothetical protein
MRGGEEQLLQRARQAIAALGSRAEGCAGAAPARAGWSVEVGALDEPVSEGAEMDIRDDGQISYAVPSGKHWTVANVFCDIEGDELVTHVPSSNGAATGRSRFRFERDGALLIENDGGQAWFERCSPPAGES